MNNLASAIKNKTLPEDLQLFGSESKKGTKSHLKEKQSKMGKSAREGSDEKEVSRQRQWQIRMRKQRRCIQCGKPAVTMNHCEEHRRIKNEMNKEWMRRNYKKD